MTQHFRCLVHLTRACAIAAALFCAPAFLSEARADAVGGCSIISLQTINFGPINVVDSSDNDSATTNLNLVCQNQSQGPSAALHICIYVNQGTNGGTSPISRFLKNGTNTILFGFYTSAAYSVPMGGTLAPMVGAPIEIAQVPSPIDGTISAIFKIYARVYPNFNSFALSWRTSLAQVVDCA